MIAYDRIDENNKLSTGERRHYEKPIFQRVDLAIEETLSVGCKVTQEACLGFDPQELTLGS